jgi:hypothetical protein
VSTSVSSASNFDESLAKHSYGQTPYLVVSLRPFKISIATHDSGNSDTQEYLYGGWWFEEAKCIRIMKSKTLVLGPMIAHCEKALGQICLFYQQKT